MLAKELVAMNEVDLLRLCQTTKCAQCGVSLHESTTGTRKTADGCLCSDCYFDRFDEELVAHPIGTPRLHKGR